MVGWHHQLDGYEFEKIQEDARHGSLAYCSPWVHKEPDTTDWPDSNRRIIVVPPLFSRPWIPHALEPPSCRSHVWPGRAGRFWAELGKSLSAS